MNALELRCRSMPGPELAAAMDRNQERFDQQRRGRDLAATSEARELHGSPKPMTTVKHPQSAVSGPFPYQTNLRTPEMAPSGLPSSDSNRSMSKDHLNTPATPEPPVPPHRHRIPPRAFRFQPSAARGTKIPPEKTQ